MTKKTLFILLTVIGLTQFGFGQNGVSTAKSALVTQLFNQTSEMLPIETIENEIRKQIEANIINSEKKYLLDPFYKQLESDTTLTEERKTELKKKYPVFVKKLSQVIRELSFDGLAMKNWYQQSFIANISKSFTSAELKKLKAYFSTPAGKDLVQKFSEISLEGYVKRIPQTENPRLKQVVAEQKDVLRKRFMNVLLKDVGKDFKKQLDIWFEKSEKETDEKIKTEAARLTAEFLEAK